MLKKLRLKFIFTNMLLVALVLVVAFGTIVLVNRNQHMAEIDNALDQALSLSVQSDDTPDGMAPPASAGGQAALPPGTPEQSGMMDDDYLDDDDLYDADDRDGFEDRGGFIATSTYVVDESGTATEMMNGMMLSDDTAQAAAAAVLASDQDKGTLSEYGLYYHCQDDDAGTTRIAFASTAYIQDATRHLLLTLGGVGIAALAVFLVISIFLARWALRPVEHAWEQQKQFVADASHELKTPLAVILANDSIIRSHPEETVASQMQWIESTQTEAKNMQELVNDMLLLAQPEDARRSETAVNIDLSEIVEMQALQFESVAFERGVNVVTSVDAGIHITGNPARLQRLVGTLIDNACKYAERGTDVTVALSSHGGKAHLAVTNHGEPIHPDDLPHIFDRFYRADKARVRTEGGFGLGLAIAKDIAEAHGGEISATSSEAEGTTFTVVLPTA